MTRTGYPYPAHYWLREGSTSKSLASNTSYDHNGATKKCIGWTVANQGAASSSSEALITPKVGGEVSFWVHRATSSTTSTYNTELDLFIMTYDANGNWTRNNLSSDITVEGLTEAKALVGADYTDANNEKWKQVTLKNVPDGTHLGIHMNGLFIDDFSASKAWLEWPSYLHDVAATPYVDVTPMGVSTKYYLDESNSFLDGDKPYELTVQLKQTVNAGTFTEDMLKLQFKLRFANLSGDDKDITLVDENNQPMILTFENKSTNDWLSTSVASNTFDNKTLKFGLKNLDPKYYNQNASLVAIKLDADNNPTGEITTIQRKNTEGADGVWNATSWPAFQFEALIPQPFMAYSLNTVTDATLASSMTGNTLSDVHPWFINPIGNEAPIYIGNNAGRAEAKINRVEFEGDGFGLVTPIDDPVTVGATKLYGVKPKVTATQPGFYSGTMKVYVQGTETPFTAKLEGAVKPNYSTKYLFHKEDGSTTGATLPEGWLATGTWAITTMSNGQHKADGKWAQSICSGSVTSGTKVLLVSPKISFPENAELWYDATCYQATGELELLYSTDRSNWTVLKNMTVNSSPSENNPLNADNFNSFLTTKGSYTENLFKTFMADIPAGEGYIAFRTGSNNARVDNIVTNGTPVTVDFDVAYISASVPGKFSLNKVKEFSVTFRNLLDEIAAEDYVLEIVQDGQVLKTVEDKKALTKGVDVTLTAQCAFSTVGEHTLSINLVKGENTVSSATFDINVVDEGYDETFQVGASHTANRLCEDYNSWPLTPNLNYAVTSEAIYPKSWLQDLNVNGASADNNGINFDPEAPMTGLKTGDKITSISWIGYAGATVAGKLDVAIPVEVYIENTTDESFANNSASFRDETNMTQVFKGTAYYDLTKTNSGTYTNATTPLVDTEEGFFKIVFEQPFEYTGNNLRVQLRLPQVVLKEENATDEKPFFDWTNNGTSIAGSLWALEAKGTATNDATYRLLYQNGSGTNKSVNALLPMLIMGKEVPAKKLTGTVSHSMTQNGVADVKVTASSAEGVAFSGLTDETGAYSIEIGNPSFDFTVTAEHTISTKFHPYTSETTVNFAEGDVEHNITLTAKTVTVSGIVVDGKDAPVEGATVTLTTDENGELTATTTADGEFSFTTSDINSTLSLEVTKTGYSSYTDDAVDVEEADVELDDIVIFKNVTISGVVKDTRNELVGGATVTLTDEDGNDATTTSDSMGEFSFTDKEANKDYTLTVSKEGYDDANEPVSVEVDDKAVTITLYDEGTSYLSSISKDGVTVTPGFGQIRIEAAGKDVVVVDMAGHVVANYANLEGSVVVVVPAGIYVVNNTKVVVR